MTQNKSVLAYLALGAGVLALSFLPCSVVWPTLPDLLRHSIAYSFQFFYCSHFSCRAQEKIRLFDHGRFCFRSSQASSLPVTWHFGHPPFPIPLPPMQLCSEIPRLFGWP